MKTFKAKVGYGLLIPILFIFLGVYLFLIYRHIPMGALIKITFIFLPVLAFILNMFFMTTYTITDDYKIKIKAGVFTSLLVEISTIRSIRKSRSWISSPAPSLDRIEIRYNNTDAVLISPADKIAFINALKEHKNNIDIDLD